MYTNFATNLQKEVNGKQDFFCLDNDKDKENDCCPSFSLLYKNTPR